MGGTAPAPEVLARLVPWCNVLLDELPWWDRAWRVTRVEPAYPIVRDREQLRARTGYIEVSIPGTLGRAGDADLPFFARAGFEGHQLIRFQAKIGDVVVGPSSTPAGQREPHPFGAVLHRLMRLRGVSVAQMARRSGLAETTVTAVSRGAWNPHHRMVTALADGLGIPVRDLLAIAGLDTQP
jgi:lambda repressor-like predicted transcriptional regulator